MTLEEKAREEFTQFRLDCMTALRLGIDKNSLWLIFAEAFYRGVTYGQQRMGAAVERAFDKAFDI